MLQCCCWQSAGCRTSWVCLQHHATVVTSGGVTICCSKFPPTVSKHCQHQHSAIHKTMQQCEISTIPAVVISKELLPQSNIMAAFVHSHSSLFSDVSTGLPTYNNIFYSLIAYCSYILHLPNTRKRIGIKWNSVSANYAIQESLWARACKIFSFSLLSPWHW